MQGTIARAAPTAEQYEQWRHRLLADKLAKLRAEYFALKDDAPPSRCQSFQANPGLNRYGNVPLLDETRVMLNDGLVGDYIHASRVDGYKKRGFIITQAPIHGTPCDYWRMVWQERIQVCVCLTVMQEDNTEKSAQFFPLSSDRPYRAGPFRIFLLEVQEQEAQRKLVVCRLRLYCWFAPSNRRERIVFLVLYGEWPDRGVPSSPVTFVNVLDGVRELQDNAWRQLRAQIDFDKTRPMTEPPPLLINCSAGIGRSATMAACIIEMERLRDTEQVDLAATVRKLRKQRCGAVQNVMQYVFIARVLVEVWERTLVEEDEETQ